MASSMVAAASTVASEPWPQQVGQGLDAGTHPLLRHPMARRASVHLAAVRNADPPDVSSARVVRPARNSEAPSSGTWSLGSGGDSVSLCRANRSITSSRVTGSSAGSDRASLGHAFVGSVEGLRCPVASGDLRARTLIVQDRRRAVVCGGGSTSAGEARTRCHQFATRRVR